MTSNSNSNRDSSKSTFQIQTSKLHKDQSKAPWHLSDEILDQSSTTKTTYGTKCENPVRTESFRPRGELELSKEPFSASTTQATEFCAWKVTPRQTKQRQEYHPPEGKMDMSTSYGNGFPTHIGVKRLPSIRPVEHKEDAKPFESTTENTERYRNYIRSEVNQARQKNCRPLHEYRSPEIPFEAKSTSINDYQIPSKGNYRTQAIRYPGEIILSTDPFENVTTSKGDFSPRREIENIKKRTAIKPLGEITIDRSPINFTTTNNEDFSHRRTIERIEKRNAFRPIGELVVSKDPLDFTTTQKEDFINRKNGERVQAVRPIDELSVSRDPFESRTIQSESFTPKKREFFVNQDGLVQSFGRKTLIVN